MKARAIYLLLAREVSTDSNDNMNSIIKIIDRFGFNYSVENLTPGTEKDESKKIIAFPITYAVASSWLFDEPIKKECSFVMKFQIKDPDGILIAAQEYPPKIVKTGFKINLFFIMQDLPATSSGMYILQAELLADGQAVSKAEYPYEVQLNVQKK